MERVFDGDFGTTRGEVDSHLPPEPVGCLGSMSHLEAAIIQDLVFDVVVVDDVGEAILVPVVFRGQPEPMTAAQPEIGFLLPARLIDENLENVSPR
jgi:hypothetical protein